MTLDEILRRDVTYRFHHAMGEGHVRVAEESFEHWRLAALEYVQERRAEPEQPRQAEPRR